MLPHHGCAIPGMDVAATGPLVDVRRGSVTVTRAAPNEWRLLFHHGGGADIVAASVTAPGSPAEILRDADAQFRRCRSSSPALGTVSAKIELDACGAWVTLANAGPVRPVVVRRAGWVDVRGHPSGPLGGAEASSEVADDRVGLGPGDALVLYGTDIVHLDADEELCTEEVLLDAALAAAGCSPEEILGFLREAWKRWAARPAEPDAILVVGVPGDLGPDPVARVAQATGVAAEQLDLPGYPSATCSRNRGARHPGPRGLPGSVSPILSECATCVRCSTASSPAGGWRSGWTRTASSCWPPSWPATPSPTRPRILGLPAGPVVHGLPPPGGLGDWPDPQDVTSVPVAYLDGSDRRRDIVDGGPRDGDSSYPRSTDQRGGRAVERPAALVRASSRALG